MKLDANKDSLNRELLEHELVKIILNSIPEGEITNRVLEDWD